MKNLASYLKGITLFILSLSLILSLLSYTPSDIAFLSAPRPKATHNIVGILGAYLAFTLFFLFGYAAYFLPFYLFFLGLSIFEKINFRGLGKALSVNVISFLLFISFLAAFIGIFFKETTLIWKYSGMVGFFISGFFTKYLGFYGSLILFSFILVVASIILFGFFVVEAFIRVRQWLFKGLKRPLSLEEKPKEIRAQHPEEAKKEESRLRLQMQKQELGRIKPEIKVYTPPIKVAKEPQTPREAIKEQKPLYAEDVKNKMATIESEERKRFDPLAYKLPSPDILKVPPALDYREVKENIEANIKNLEDTLSDFGVEARVVSVQKGPVVTMYELQPAAGVKIQKISALSDDIALAMKSSSVRVVAPLPGRGTVGVEVPNEKKHLVYLREVLEEKTFVNATSKLTLAIGKDVSGNPVVADLNEMPHLLIAGTTGSGKTVCVNSLICSILSKAKPDEAKFILIDPKMVELAPFAGIPHLLHPIIFEAKKAFIALNWAVEEMERRYHILAEQGVRNIDMYNKDRTKDKMYYIIIVVDELADLMVVAKENIETAIQRLAQLSRAVGIHLILATQRPSVDVITGVIKANFPARISFKVSSKVDSRTVLDIIGAEKLLGKGDLLFLKPGASKMIRAQGCFMDDEDIENFTNFVSAQGAPIYEEGILEGEKRAALKVEQDELLDEAIKTILQARQASASILQRRLRVGYTRAARLLDLMEQNGIVGPFCGSKAREILVDAEGYLKEKGWQ